MGLRTNAVFIGLAAALYSSLATALGLGEIKLHSALNQPLDAEIQLLHVRDLTEQEIVVGLASPRDFERAGVEREFFLTNLDFDVDLDAQGGPVVRLRSENPVREPFLNFIVTAEWPSGKLLREYTLLVDLPLYAEEKPDEVQAAQRQTETRRATTPEPTSEPVSRPRQPSTVSRPAAPRESYDMEEYGPVGANENLWSIANRLRPDSDVSVQQTMLAIQRLNPDAFINNNINLLRRGQVLRVPGKDDIQSLTARDAIREVAAQNQAWSDRTTRTDRSAQLEGSKRAVEAPRTPAPVEGRIKLSSADDRDASTGVATGDGDTGDSAIKAELSVTQEELDAASRENAELKSRIQAIEEQIATMERLVKVSNDELRALEMAAQQANEAQASATDDASLESDTPVGEADEPAESISPVEQVDEERQQQVPPVDDPREPAPRADTRQQTSWLDWVKDNLLYVAGGLGALVVLLAIYLFMRNREEEFDDFDDDEFTSQVEPFELDDDQGVQDDESRRSEDGYAAGFDEADSASSDTTEEDVHVEPETEDVVGECDIHIAYGQYDQAEEKLVRALDKDPENIAIRMKLLEVFTVQGDIEGFDSHYAKLRVIADSESIAQAEAMREGFQDAPEFDESLYDTGAFLAGLSASGAHSTSSSEAAEETFDSSTDTVDFDFDEEAPDAFESDSESAMSDDSSLEFDLDFEDDATLVPEPASTEGVSDEDEVVTDDLDDLDTDFENIDFDLDNDDLEVGLDLDEEQPDQTRIAEPSKGSVDVESEDLGADFDEFDVSLDESEVSSLGEGFDDFDAQLEDSSGDLPGEDEFADFATDLDSDTTSEKTEALDFDLDRDLEDAMASKEKPEQQETSFSDLDLNELDDSSLSEEGMSDELDAANDEREETVIGSEPDVADEAGDFDLDYDLDADVNLDELDQELGELDIEDEPVDPSAVTPQMEEPEVDFGEVESLAESEPETESVSSEGKRTSATDDVEIPDFDPENDDDSSLEFLSENDETATKLDLARAYIDMGDAEGAKDILDEITEEGNDDQKKEAETLLSKLA